mmetsp:Transcript_86205/g.200451  ORF Transcript_86205/g.200451 Transcript_86205/m.200451 type:complete len:637 (+) Transcript_86205:84-1994(+)
MDIATAAELVKAPLPVLDNLFAKRIAAVGSERGVPAEWGEKEHLVQTLGLQDEEAFARIPCINDAELAEAVPPFSLVRYRGLVQDVFEPEIYAAVFEERAADAAAGAPVRLVTSKYRECVEPTAGFCLHELGREGLSQRGACYCVPLPGETAWAAAASVAATNTAVNAWLNVGVQCNDVPATPPVTTKRPRPDEDVNMIPDEPPKDVRRVRTVPVPAAVTNARMRSASEFGLNFPLRSEERLGRGSSCACIVKLYDEDMESLRLQDVVEVLGVLCVNPEMADFDTTPLEHVGLGRDARQPSTSLVPRIHALLVRRLPFYHPLLPYSPSWLSEARLAAAYQNRLAAPGVLAAARATALEQLKLQLGGDELAAHYVLMQLVSRAFGKHGDQVLGSWALNLTAWPDGVSAGSLGEALAELVPRSVCLSLTAETLGSQRWRPRKDFVANRLVAGQLQLAPGSVLLLDETAMAESEVSAEGVKALSAINALVMDQVLTCDFASYDVKIPLELSCILVSKKRSIIKDISVTLPLRPAAPVPAAGKPSRPGSLDAARFLLGLVTRRPRPMRIPDDVSSSFGEDFAAVRQELQVQPQLCHAWMSLARAFCLTTAEEELTAERWQAVLQLERERLRRCVQEGLLS